MPSCPSDDDLSGFLNESLPHERISTVSVHVDSCASCQKRLDKLTHDTEGAVARYRNLSDSTDSHQVASHPDAGTLIIGVNSLPPASRFTGVPSVPGFDVLEEIGRGGMGVVYKARHQRLNRLVALKMVLAGSAADPRVIQRFLFEAEILARIQHPQVVQVYEVDTYKGPNGIPIPYLAMELLEGGTLSQRLRKLAAEAAQVAGEKEFKPFRLDQRTAAELIEGIARAVHAAHLQGVIHRDLKPGNILFASEDIGPRNPPLLPAGTDAGSGPSLSAERSGLRPKVTDFGLAKFTLDAGADLTGSGQVVGTPQYMAPEQAAGRKQIGPPADVYSLGAMLFECLTGRPPFHGDEPMHVLLKVVNESPPSVSSLSPGLNRDLAAVVMHCLEKEPRRRYSSALELAEDLRRFLDRRPTLARPVKFRERAWLWARRNPAMAGMMGVVAIVLFASFVGITAFWLKAESKADDERRARENAMAAQATAVAAHQAAATSLEEAHQHKRTAELSLAQLEFARAVSWCDEDRVSQGLESFVRSIQLAESVGAEDLARVGRINLALWPQEIPHSRKALVHTTQPRDIAFFPDGTRAVVGARGGGLFVWDTRNDQKLLTYKTRFALARTTLSGFSLSFIFWTVAVSPDGKKVAAGGSDGQVWVWDADKPEALFTLEAAPPGGDIWGIAFTENEKLWCTNGGSVIKCWDLGQRRPIGEIQVPGTKDLVIQSLALSKDRKRIYSGDRGGAIWEFDAVERKPIQAWNVGGWVTALALSPDGTCLAATGTNGYVHILDLASKLELHRINLSRAYGKGLAFAPTRDLLVASDTEGSVRGWNWKTGVPVGVPVRLTGEVLGPRFFPNSEDFAVPAGNALFVCRMANPRRHMLTTSGQGRVLGLDFSPDGERLALAQERTVREFRLQAGPRAEPGQARTFEHSTQTLHYDPDLARNRLLRGTREGFETLSLPDLIRQKFLNDSGLFDLKFSPTGQRTFVIHRESLASWDATSFTRPLHVFRDPDMAPGIEMQAMDVRPDGRELLAAYSNKLIFLDPETLEKSRPGWDVADDILDARYMPDGTAILIARRDSVAQIHDASNGQPLGQPLTHSRAVLVVAPSPDGKVLLTGSRDGTARFWDSRTGLPLGPPLRHFGPVTRLGYHPKGLMIATGSGEGEASLCPVPPPPLAGSIEDLRNAVKKAQE